MLIYASFKARNNDRQDRVNDRQDKVRLDKVNDRQDKVPIISNDKLVNKISFGHSCMVVAQIDSSSWIGSREDG